MPCPLIFPLESFCFEDVTVHETSLGMSRYIFLHDWGVLVKKASQSIKVLMTKKTGSFVRASNEVGFQDIHSKICNIYLVNFTDGNTLKLTGFPDREDKAEYDCLVV